MPTVMTGRPSVTPTVATGRTQITTPGGMFKISSTGFFKINSTDMLETQADYPYTLYTGRPLI